MFDAKIVVTKENGWGTADTPASVEITVQLSVGDEDNARKALDEAYAEACKRIGGQA